MDIVKLYYYTSIPIITCNMLFYSITVLSTSITSSQNVIKFVTENKICDRIKFKDEIEALDIQNKLRIVESLIFDIIKRTCKSDDEFNKIKNSILEPVTHTTETDDFIVLNINYENCILNQISEPLRYALLSTSEVIQNINSIIINVRDKILQHEKSYLNKLMTLCLQHELKQLQKYVNLLDKRLALLFDLIRIYSKN